MEAILTPVLNQFDSTRAWMLRHLLQTVFLKNLFVNRSYRLFGLFLLVTTVYLILSGMFPLWILLTGPIIYGVPHIFSSIRFTHYDLKTSSKNIFSVSAQTTLKFLGALWILVLSIRLITDFNLIQLPNLFVNTDFPEVVAATLTLVGCAFLFRKSIWQGILGLMVLSPLAYFSYVAPAETLGFLILFHNLVAFIFWYRASKSDSEKIVANLALLIFVLVNFAIFAGAFDFLCSSAQTSIFNGAIDIENLGRMIAPWTHDYSILFHCVVAYAFGQSLHYFIWLKAIADQNHEREVPTTFRESFKLLKQDYGRTSVALIVSACAIGVLIWLFFEVGAARQIYFCISAFHGYLEMAVLSLLIAGSFFKVRENV